MLKPVHKTPKNILIISSIFYPNIFGGAEIAAYNRAKMLVKRGHRVSIATIKEKNEKPVWGEMAPEGFKVYRIDIPRRYTLFERNHNFPLWEKSVWHLQDYFDPRNKGLIGTVLDNVKPDYAFIDNIIGLGFNSLNEIGRRKVPTAYVLHDLNLACFQTNLFCKGLQCKKQCNACRMISYFRQRPLKAIPRLGFISPSWSNLAKAKELVPAIHDSFSCVIPNVPEEVPAFLPKRKPSDHVRLLFAGRLDPIKGIDFLLETLAALEASYKFHLTVLGTGPIENNLKKQYGSRPWVTFKGFVPREDIAGFMREADLFCMTSVIAESYGLVTAQALQLGTPVIGSDLGGTPELVRDGVTGMLVPPGDKNAWLKAFCEIFAKPAQLSIWQKNTCFYAHEFDEKVIGEAHEEFFERLSCMSAEKR